VARRAIRRSRLPSECRFAGARHNTWDRGVRVISVSEGFAAEAQLPIRVVAFETRTEVIVLVGEMAHQRRKQPFVGPLLHPTHTSYHAQARCQTKDQP
jgi:hypothetical protein